MKIQVNSDKTVAVDASLISFVESEAERILGRFDKKLTRVEVHLSDVDGKKSGQLDKRCLVEVRPAGAQPLSASAKTPKMATAVGTALGKMQRLLTTFFGRRGDQGEPVKKTAATKKPPVRKSAVKKPVAKKVAVKKPAAPAKKKAVAESEEFTSRGPKKKAIYQARRKSWPAGQRS